MARIYRKNDRIKIQIDDIVVSIRPLTLHQKNEVQKLMIEGQKSGDLAKLNESLLLAIKYCVKDMQGVKDGEGEDYRLSFNDDQLSDECIEDLMNMEQSPSLLKVCASFVAGIPKSFDIAGVAFVDSAKK